MARILAVDDEKGILNLVKRVLEIRSEPCQTQESFP